MSWARKNVATIVTWAVLALGAAVALGAATTEIGELRKDVDQVTGLFEAARVGLVALQSDVRSLRARSEELAQAVAELRAVVAEQRVVVARLEVLVGRLDARPPP